MSKKINAIAVVTPGGDAPGMNTAVRAVVRTALYYKARIFGIQRGWYGAANDLIEELTPRSVSGIINRGGTCLRTKRCPEFKDKNVRKRAFENLKKKGIEGIVAIGGDGTLRASTALMKEFGLPINVVPASIDNDIPGTDFTIGFDTAVNTAMEGIDKIRDTATSHDRLFVVEVMGRNNGFIAADVGLVCGAEAVLVPEVKWNINTLAGKIQKGRELGKESFIIVVAEGAVKGRDLAEKLGKILTDMDIRVSVLGHIQRGGSPSALSRELACKLGAKATEMLLRGKAGYLVGSLSDRVRITPIKDIKKKSKKIELEQLRIAAMLAG